MPNIRYIKNKRLSDNTWEFCFTKPFDYIYIPGQYAEFSLPPTLNGSADQRRRTMTIVSHPEENQIRFSTRLIDPMSSFKQHLFTLRPNDVLYISEPMGDVVLPKLASVPLVFIAGGIGIASFVSMLEDVTRAQQTRSITLFYAYHSPSDRMYGDILDTFPFMEFQEFVSPSRLQLSSILDSIVINDAQFYISGTEAFTMSFVDGLRQAGISDLQIVFDYFTGYSDYSDDLNSSI